MSKIIKISPGLSIRCKGPNCHTIDYIITRWKFLDKAFARIESYIGASLELLDKWQVKKYDGKEFNCVPVKVTQSWSLKNVSDTLDN